MISDAGLYRAIGDLVRFNRRRSGMTQELLAERAGLTRTSITNVEAGNQQIRVHTLFRIAQGLGVSPLELLPVVDETTSNEVDEQLKDKELAETEREWVKRIISS